jgi:DNA mismatch repair ATPase MutL
VHFTIGDYVLDIAQNAIEAGARTIVVELDEKADCTSVRVTDDGCGMSEDEKTRALDPFYTDGIKHKNRRVGLGIPFLVQAVE